MCLCIYQNEQTHLQVISISIYLSTKFNGCLVEVAWFHLFEPHLLEPNKPKVKANQLDVEIAFGMHSMGTNGYNPALVILILPSLTCSHLHLTKTPHVSTCIHWRSKARFVTLVFGVFPQLVGRASSIQK